MNRRSKTILLSGIIAVIATIIIALVCIDDWTGLTGWAFATMLWSELVFVGGLVFVEWVAKRTEQIVTRSTVYTVATAYAVINFIVSIPYIAFFKEANTSFVVIQTVLFAVAAIAIVISLSASKGISNANEKTMKSVANAEALIERLDKLAKNPNCENFSSTLKKVSEDLRYTDISATVSEDAEINEVISAIEIEIADSSENTAENIKASLIRLNALVAQRKISASATKKGRI